MKLNDIPQPATCEPTDRLSVIHRMLCARCFIEYNKTADAVTDAVNGATDD